MAGMDVPDLPDAERLEKHPAVARNNASIADLPKNSKAERRNLFAFLYWAGRLGRVC